MNRTMRIFGFLAGAALLPAMAQPQTAPAPQISSLNARTVLLEAAHWMTVTNNARVASDGGTQTPNPSNSPVMGFVLMRRRYGESMKRSTSSSR